MNIVVDRNELLKAIKSVKGAAAKSAIHPILQAVHIEIGTNSVELCCTDLVNRIDSYLDAEIKESGKCCVNVSKLEEIVTHVEDKIELKIVENYLVVKSGNSKFKVLLLGVEEFPLIANKEKEIGYISVGAKQFSDSLKKMMFSTVSENGILSGVNIKLKDNVLKLAATDGNRLSFITIDKLSEFEADAICPVKILQEVAKTNSEEIKIYFSPKHIKFETDNTLYQTQLLEGNYPNIEGIIPKANPNVATVDTSLLLSALERVAIMANEQTNVICFDFKNNELLLVAQNPDGNAQDIIDVEFNGEIKLAFNYRYFLDALKVIDEPTITLEMNTPLSPCLIKSNFIHLIMPIQVK